MKHTSLLQELYRMRDAPSMNETGVLMKQHRSFMNER